MKMKAKRFTAIFFLSVIIIFVCLVSAGTALKLTRKFEVQQPTVKKTGVKWENLYPLDKNNAYKQPVKLERLFMYIKGKIQDAASKTLIGYMNIVETAKKYEELIGWNIASVYEYNGVTRLHDGYLTGISRPSEVSLNAEAVIDFAGWCRNRGIDFCYVNTPSKICFSEDKEVYGILDFSNQNADEFLRLLDNAGVTICDLRKKLHEDGMKHHESFYVTDHHWKTETGLWAAKHILKLLKHNYGWDVDPEILNPDKIEHVVYPEWFLGSQGKKFMLSRTKPDDFTMLYPKYDTRLHYEIPDRNIDLSGDFSITYDMSQVESKDYYGKNPYGAYNHGNNTVIRIHNYMSPNGYRVLMFHHSYGNCVAPFVALGAEYTEEINAGDFQGSIKKYIEHNTPDIVIVMYDSGYTGLIGNWNTLHVGYDFR